MAAHVAQRVADDGHVLLDLVEMPGGDAAMRAANDIAQQSLMRVAQVFQAAL